MVLIDDLKKFIQKIKLLSAGKKLIAVNRFKQNSHAAVRPDSMGYAWRAGNNTKKYGFTSYKDIQQCIRDTELSEKEVETAINRGYLPKDYEGGDVNWIGDQIYHYAIGKGVIEKIDKRFSRVTICEKIVGINPVKTVKKKSQATPKPRRAIKPIPRHVTKLKTTRSKNISNH